MADEEDEKVVGEALNDLSKLFDQLCQSRHDEGAVKYGVGTYLQNDVLRMAAEEIIDMANYARYQFIKLMMIQAALDQLTEDSFKGQDTVTIGVQSFKGTKEGWK